VRSSSRTPVVGSALPRVPPPRFESLPARLSANDDSLLHDDRLRAGVDRDVRRALSHDDGALSHDDPVTVFAPRARSHETREARDERTHPNHSHQSFHGRTLAQIECSPRNETKVNETGTASLRQKAVCHKSFSIRISHSTRNQQRLRAFTAVAYCSRDRISPNPRPTSRRDPYFAPVFPVLHTVVWRLLTAQPSCGGPPGWASGRYPRAKDKSSWPTMLLS
jgi:hypothetical protein